MFGQAIGDALGLGTEFMQKCDIEKYYPDGLSRYEQILQDYHRERWHKGDWTDDTDMWMCIADAIIADNGSINPTSIAQNFKDWHNGTPLGCGGHTNKVLSMVDYVEKPFECSRVWWELSMRTAAANGALMRTSTVALLPDYKPEYAETVCKLSHADPRCVGSCVVVCDIIHALAYGKSVPTLNDVCLTASRYDERITEYIMKAYTGSLGSIVLDDYTMGYTLNTLFVALWTYFHVQTFEQGLLAVVNAGGDADTNAAVACSILGSEYGFDHISPYYVDNLYRKNVMLKCYNDFSRTISCKC